MKSQENSNPLDDQHEVEMKVSIDMQRAFEYAMNATDSLTDSIRELLANSIDAIKDHSKGKILIDVKENSVSVFDNGDGCIDVERFTILHISSLEGAKMGEYGIGLKSNLKYFEYISIISKDKESGKILYISKLRYYNEEGKFNPRYTYKIYKKDDPGYNELQEKLGIYNTNVSAIDPKNETDMNLLFGMINNRSCVKRSSLHIMNICEGPLSYLESGGEIAVMDLDGTRKLARHKSFANVKKENRIIFTSDKPVDLWGKIINPIHEDCPEQAIKFEVAISDVPLNGKGFQEVYLDNLRIRIDLEYYCKDYLPPSGSRKGMGKLQIRIFLSPYYKKNGLLNHNKHSIQDIPKLQKYLSILWCRFGTRIQELEKKAKNAVNGDNGDSDKKVQKASSKNPKKDQIKNMGFILSSITAIEKQYGNKNDSILHLCKEIRERLEKIDEILTSN